MGQQNLDKMIRRSGWFGVDATYAGPPLVLAKSAGTRMTPRGAQRTDLGVERGEQAKAIRGHSGARLPSPGPPYHTLVLTPPPLLCVFSKGYAVYRRRGGGGRDGHLGLKSSETNIP